MKNSRWIVTLLLLPIIEASCQRQGVSEAGLGWKLRPGLKSSALPGASATPQAWISSSASPSPSPSPRTLETEAQDARKNRLRQDLSGLIEQKRLALEQVEGEISVLRDEIASSASTEREQAGQVAREATRERLQVEERAIQWQAYLDELGTRIQQQQAVVQGLEQQNRYWSSLNIDTDEFRAVKERLAIELPRLQDFQAQRTNGQAQARLDATLQSSRSSGEVQERFSSLQQLQSRNWDALQARIEQLEAQAEKLRQEGRSAEQQFSRLTG